MLRYFKSTAFSVTFLNLIDHVTVMSSAGTFAAAQQRIQARQEARRQEAFAAQQAQRVFAQESALGRLPYPLDRAAGPLTSL